MTALGGDPLTPRERADRFEDFTAALDVMLTEPSGTYADSHYGAPDYRTLPGCVQQPRVPFTIAATGPRGFGLAARYARCWVTYGPPSSAGDATGPAWYEAVAGQLAGLDDACRKAGRDPGELRRMALVALEANWIHGSVASWEDFTGRIAELGFTDVVLHWPRPEDAALPGCDPRVFDEISSVVTESGR